MTEPEFTSAHCRNNIIAWVVVSYKGVDVFSVNLPADISDEDLKAAERDILRLAHSAFLMGERSGVRQVRDGIKTALGI